MKRTPRLSKSGIEYLDYVWNFCSGCTNGCSYCWARQITKRFPAHYPNGFEPTIYPEAFLSPLYLKKPSIIGCVFMGDLFDDSIDPTRKIQSVMPSGKASVAMSLKGWIFTTIKQCPQHTFVFLTKQPQNLIKWSPFPENCWVGVTLTTKQQHLNIFTNGFRNVEASIKFVSLEPLLENLYFHPEDIKTLGINWVIIGSQTKPYKPPKIEWVTEIIEACDKAGVAVFQKDNLLVEHDKALKQGLWGLERRQELPK